MEILYSKKIMNLDACSLVVNTLKHKQKLTMLYLALLFAMAVAGFAHAQSCVIRNDRTEAGQLEITKMELGFFYPSDLVWGREREGGILWAQSRENEAERFVAEKDHIVKVLGELANLIKWSILEDNLTGQSQVSAAIILRTKIDRFFDTRMNWPVAEEYEELMFLMQCLVVCYEKQVQSGTSYDACIIRSER